MSLHRSAGVHRPLITSLGAPGRGWGRAEEWPRPRPVSSPERLLRGVSHGASAASFTADSPTWKGHPARRPAGGRRAGQPSHHGAWKVGEVRALRGSTLPRDPRRKAHNPHKIGAMQPSQFKRPEDLHEDRWVPNVHVVPRRLRLTVPGLQKEYRLVYARLNCRRKPPFTGGDARKAVRVCAHLRHRELDILAHALR